MLFNRKASISDPVWFVVGSRSVCRSPSTITMRWRLGARHSYDEHVTNPCSSAREALGQWPKGARERVSVDVPSEMPDATTRLSPISPATSS